MDRAGELPVLRTRPSKYESNWRAYVSACFTLTLTILGRRGAAHCAAG